MVNKDNQVFSKLENTFICTTELYTFLLNGDLTNVPLDSKKRSGTFEADKTLRQDKIFNAPEKNNIVKK